ncbi:MAG: serine/threonine protein kinase [Cyanobacteria bacterium RM1_2_2]|nr:serine/threonine protein kinase [Cyanobacteria bacterium RM1_2_2]
MQPPISTGTILQNRYLVLSILGQGGFGRTYLAEDQGRFNEKCALKEFIPPQGSDYALTKARELFQREAATLYQISHPQIPQFRATFEENQRLFLVQDYVHGKTYRALLNERKMRGATFSDAEVLQLIYQILPVLAHIHARGIIHRDIAPDNIILRLEDSLPVLIDFGVVKEIATRFQASETEVPTTVGKLGYAPSEQMQTGRAYPNSDLYSLAVSAIVLMTGREPQELYDDRNLVWHWEERVPTLHPKFAAVLNRMLSYRPGDRYQSVSEVAQALQAMVPAAPTPTPVPTPTPPPSTPAWQPPTPTPTAWTPPKPSAVNPQSGTGDLSRVKTVAVGRRVEPISTHRPSQSAKPAAARPTPPPMVPLNDETSIWENPWAVIAIGLGLATVTGIAAWAIVSALLNTSSPTPIDTPSPSPVIVDTPSPSPEPEPSPAPPPNAQPIEYTQRLALLPTGEQKTVEGSLAANETIVYTLLASQGQTLTATLEGEGAVMSVLTPDRQPISSQAEQVPSWQGELASNGDYAIRLRPVRGVFETDYKLTLRLESAAPSPEPEPSPEPSPSPPPEPEIDVQVLTPTDLINGVQVSEQASETQIKRYLVNVQPEQVLKAELLQGAVTLNIRYPDGSPVENASGIVTWNSLISEAGQYQIDVIATQPTDFVLSVAVQGAALPSTPESPLPQ